MPDLNLIESYDYKLPEELIAQSPADQRDQSRLMLLDRETGSVQHRQFFNLIDSLKPHDCLVLNQTRVVPARLRGLRDITGGKWEGLFLSLQADGNWEILSKTRGKLQPGENVTIQAQTDDGSEPARKIQIEFIERGEQGRWIVRPVVELSEGESIWDLLEQIGSVPLPPYIRHGEANAEDAQRYQSVYASVPGAAAAPTAGLHFSKELLEKCKQAEVSIAYVTLHVGLGTFRPVSVSKLDEHEMHSEWCEVDAAAVEIIQQSQKQGGRVIAVGTTTVRTLESAARAGDGELKSWEGDSTLFIRPGFKFRVVEGLITNYHLPQSTLLVLLSAFAGYENVMNAYQIAIEEKYRFFSYGDAMLVLPGNPAPEKTE
ncbi:MAG: tRNA preQ1(34) S-adenosylmethionine ribosyltransferase-isomerase QueA [Planctomycetaceae bacterium]|nr:tRNA preQ1(34) S-adenosylmethionine ribosyltransferase-isomerase QueA [Planctomycetaceae bacterium]MBL4884775.1 tRNA preQ1(34) S-adenosylmethionine ribosyltransferase-isomerase QueA [Planctomycetaceae bacterium]